MNDNHYYLIFYIGLNHMGKSHRIATGKDLHRAFLGHINRNKHKKIEHGYFKGKTFDDLFKNKEIHKALESGTCSGLSYANMRAHMENKAKAKGLKQLFQGIVDGKYNNRPAVFEIALGKVLFYSIPSLLIPGTRQNDWEAIDRYEHEKEKEHLETEDLEVLKFLDYSEHYLRKTNSFCFNLTSSSEHTLLLKTYKTTNRGYSVSSDHHAIARVPYDKEGLVRESFFDAVRGVGIHPTTSKKSNTKAETEDGLAEKYGQRLQDCLFDYENNMTIAQMEYELRSEMPSSSERNSLRDDRSKTLYKKILLDRLRDKGWEGLQLNQKDKYGITSLQMATIFDDTDTVKILLNIEDFLFKDILQDTKLCRKLCEQKGITKLLKSKKGQEQIREILREKLKKHDTELDLAADEDVTPIQIAAFNNNIEVVELLLHKFDENTRNKQTKLIIAIINSQDEKGNTLLNYAARNGHQQVVQFLKALHHNKNILKNSGKKSTRETPGDESTALSPFEKLKIDLLKSEQFTKLKNHTGAGNKKDEIIPKFIKELRKAEGIEKINRLLSDDTDYQLDYTSSLDGDPVLVPCSSHEQSLRGNTGTKRYGSGGFFSPGPKGHKSTTDTLIIELQKKFDTLKNNHYSEQPSRPGMYSMARRA